MERKIQVVLYGDSLFLNGIARCLEKGSTLDVVHVQGGTPEVGLQSARAGSCLLVFDTQETPPDLMLDLFKKMPQLTLLALDPESDRLLVFSSQVSDARTIGDLLETIRRYGKGEMQRDVEQECMHSEQTNIIIISDLLSHR